VKTGIQSFQELLDSRLRGNDTEGAFFKGLDPGVDPDLAERNIQILRADGISAAVSGGLIVLLDRRIVPSFVRWFTIGLRHLCHYE